MNKTIGFLLRPADSSEDARSFSRRRSDPLPVRLEVNPAGFDQLAEPRNRVRIVVIRRTKICDFYLVLTRRGRGLKIPDLEAILPTFELT